MPEGVLKTAGKPIRDVASPYFSQKWNLFAPNISRVNTDLQMQAQWLDGAGERERSDWFSVTGIDYAALPMSIHPSRAHKTADAIQSRFYTSYNKLEKDQKSIFRDTFIKVDGDDFAAKTTDELMNELSEFGNNRNQLRSALRNDDMLVEYLSYMGTAYVERDIIRLRWRIHRTYPNSFEERFEEEPTRDPLTVTFGWRQVLDDLDDRKQAIFNDYVDRKIGERP